MWTTRHPFPSHPLHRLHDIAVGWQFRAVRSEVDDWRRNLVEYEDRRPAMMVDRLLVRSGSRVTSSTRSNFILVDNLVMLWRRSDGIESRIPSRGISIRIFRHNRLPQFTDRST